MKLHEILRQINPEHLLRRRDDKAPILPKVRLATDFNDRVTIPRRLWAVDPTIAENARMFAQAGFTANEFTRRLEGRIAIAAPTTLGDPTCLNSAHSLYLRCAVNPCGPCEGCSDRIEATQPEQ